MHEEQLQQDMQTMRYKNEAFFKHYEPSIYNLIADKKFSAFNLTIIPKDSDQPEIDVINKGQSIYFGEGYRYCKAESDKFLKQMAPGTEVPYFRATNPDKFLFNRMASIDLNKLASQLNNIIDINQPIKQPDFLPLLVIMGTGISKHIENIISCSKIGSLIIYENNLERFLVSLYTIDWEEICDHFDIDKGHSIQFIVCANDEYQAQYGLLWNELINYIPQYPFSAMFYNHLSDPLNEKIINETKINNVSFLNQWGHYDDEINQYNNARHNLRLNAKIFEPSKFRVNKHIPVAIVASGPSLDDKIELIKEFKEDLLIISCGTALGTLFKHSIKPDFHVELESDFLVYETIMKSSDEAFRKGITLLASAQANPKALTLFEESLIFFKDSTALSELFLDNKADVIANTTPTCTNAGCGIAMHLGFHNIFLFGTDFGFKDKSSHHSSDSIYYKDHAPDVLKSETIEDLKSTTTTTNVAGQPIETKPMYLTSKIRLEECIKFSHKRSIKVFNCSDGAAIKNSHWQPLTATREKLKSFDNVAANPKELASEIYKHSHSLSTEYIDERSKLLLEIVDTTFKTLIKREPKGDTMYDISNHLFIINNIVNLHCQKKFGLIHYFLRGHIWLYITMYYSASLHAISSEQRVLVKKLCKEWLSNHHKKIIREMKHILFHDTNVDNDTWILTTVEKLPEGTQAWKGEDEKVAT